MTFQSPDTPRISFRVTTRTKDELERLADKNGTTVSDVLRNAVSDMVESPDTVGGIYPPDDEQLRAAYVKLREATTDEGWIPREDAKTVVAQATRRPKTTIERTVLAELQARGYVRRSSDWDGRNTRYKVLK